MSAEQNALVPSDPAQPPAPPERHGGFLWDPATAQRPMWTNCNVENVHGRRALMKMRCRADRPGDELVGQLVHVTHAMVHEVHLTKEDGAETVSLPRTVFFAADGSTLAFVSMGAYESLRFILAIYGQGPWEPPLPVRVRQVKTRSGFRTYELLVEEEVPADAPAAKKGGKHG